MTEIKILIEAHAYDSDGLHDEYFDDSPGYGIAGPEVMEPLVPIRGTIMGVSFNEETTLGDIEKKIREYIWNDSDSSDIVQHYARFSFVVDNRRYEIADPTRSFVYILNKYLDVDSTGHITVCFLVSHVAGNVEPKNGPLKYSVHPREKGSHNEPHIHVEDKQHRYSAALLISDGSIIAGNLPPKYAKIAKNTILAQQDYYQKCWNTMTDGLKVDINHDFGIVAY